MNRRKFLAAVSAAAFISCAREEKRAPRYDPHTCPFCSFSREKGVCTYCNGSKKCGFCNGTGTRKVVVPDLPAKGIASTGYEEKCPHCGGRGVCRYCNGKGTCWACDGTGKVDSWDFHSKSRE
jgi:DnaJ-class molecular chaperone